MVFVLGQATRAYFTEGRLPLASWVDPHPSRACQVAETVIGGGLLVWSLSSYAWIANPDWWISHQHVTGWRHLLDPLGAALYLASIAVLTAGNLSMGSSWFMGIKAEPQPLVTRGVFAHVRHPIYTGMIGYLTATAMIMPTFWMIAVMAATCVGILMEAALEEDYWMRHRPEEYAELVRRTDGFLPFKALLRWATGRR